MVLEYTLTDMLQVTVLFFLNTSDYKAHSFPVSRIRCIHIMF